MQLTEEVREQMVLELAKISTELGWDPSLLLLIASDLAKASLMIELNKLDPEHQEVFNHNLSIMQNFIKQRVDGYSVDTVTKVIVLSDVLSRLIIKLAKENVRK